MNQDNLRTSPGSYQAWVAVADGDGDLARQLRKGAGADLTASGATRVSGSLNFKEKYAPAFPRVETVHASPGRVVTRDELEAFGIVAPAEKTAPAATHSARCRPPARRWPSYQRCVDNAPPASEGGRPDRSRADYTFCLLVIDWGWSVEETAVRLMQESGKAQENGEAYARRMEWGRLVNRAAIARLHGVQQHEFRALSSQIVSLLTLVPWRACSPFSASSHGAREPVDRWRGAQTARRSPKP